jgi:hypothetical protein
MRKARSLKMTLMMNKSLRENLKRFLRKKTQEKKSMKSIFPHQKLTAFSPLLTSL